MDEQSELVQVFVRIRPENETEAKLPGSSPNRHLNSPNGRPYNVSSGCCISASDDKTIRLIAPDNLYSTRKSVSAVDDKIYSFDKVFLEDSTQEQIYASVADHVLATVRGYNSTIFAYGVTGSGKSFTMTGNKQCPGIIPRAIGDIFRHIDQAAADSDVIFYVRLSYVELYNNSFRNLLEHVSKEQNMNKSTSSANASSFFSEMDDLEAYEAHLGPTFAYARATSAASLKEYPGASTRSEKIEVRETQNAGVFLSGPNLRFPVTSAVDAFQLINKGNKMRAVSSTNCNDQSSRSHAILTFHVESRLMESPLSPDPSSKPEMRIGKIHFVDLAGSERLALSGAEGETLVETKNINSSLTALGDVLSALSRNATAQGHQARALLKQSLNRSLDSSLDKQAQTQFPVPYRNSKLTHLLKDSLGGNSKTVMITNIRKSNEYYQQTAISLMYAARAKKVRNRSTINRNVTGDSMIHTTSTEIERLRKRLEERSNEFERLRLIQLKDSRENGALKSRLQEMKLANEAEKKMLEHQVSQLIHSQAGHLASQKEKIAQLQTALQDELTISQNRIAEQEQEIKWLKKALDESNQFASHDQVQKLQHAIDVWQGQAKSAHHELTTVLGQAEELKSLNTVLMAKIQDLEHSKKQLGEELHERSNECAEVTDKLYKAMKEKDALREQTEAAQKAFEEARNAMKDQIQVIKEREAVVAENTALIAALEKDLKAAKDKQTQEASETRLKQHQWTTKVADLEREKVELAAKLNTALRTLEKKSQQMIEDAQVKLHEHDQRATDAEVSNRRLRDDLERLKADYADLKSIHEQKLAGRDKSLEEVKAHVEQERQWKAQQTAHLLAVEGENESMKEKINVLQQKLKEKSEGHTRSLEDLQAAMSKLEQELRDARQSKEDERATLMREFDAILVEKRALHKTEIQGLQEQFERSLAAKDVEMNLIHEKHERELKDRDVHFQGRLRDTERKVRELIESELEQGMARLEERHRQEVEHLKAHHVQELQDAHTAMRNMLVKQKDEAISDVESKLASIHAANVAAELEMQRQQLQRDFAEKQAQALEKAAAEYATKLAEASRGFEEDRRLLSEDLNASFEKDKQRALAELERQLTKQHGEILMQAEERFSEELRSRERDFQKQLSEKSAAEVKKAVALERELLTMQLADEKERALNELRTKLLIDFNANIQATRTALLEERTKTLRELEDSSSALLEDKDATIAQLTQQIKQVTSMHRDELSQALFEQHVEIMAKSKAELEKLRRDFADSALQHQAELNALYKANAEALAQQRAQLDEAHAQVVEALQEECKGTREKLHEVLESRASNQHTEDTLRIEHQKHLDELLGQRLADLRETHESTLSKLHKQHHEDIMRMKVALEQMENDHMAILRDKDESHTQELDKLRNQLAHQHGKELQLLRQQMEDEMERQRDEVLYAKDEEIKKEKVDLRAQLASKAHTIQELEEQVESLNQNVIDLTVKFNRERLEYLENYKTQQLSATQGHVEEMEKLEAAHANMLQEVRSKHQEQLQTLREELSRNLLRQVGEGAETQRQQDELYQQEITKLRKALSEATQKRQEETSRYEIDVQSCRETIQTLQEELTVVKTRANNEKERLRLTMEESFTVQLTQERHEHERALLALRTRLEQEIRQWQDVAEDSKGSQDSLASTLRIQLQDTKKTNQQEIERLHTALLHAEEHVERIEAAAKREKDHLLQRFEKDKAAWQVAHEETLQFERQEAQDVLTRKLADQKERLEREVHALEVALTQEKYHAETKIQELQEELHLSAQGRELLLTDKITQYEAQLQQARHDHDEAVKQLTRTMDEKQDAWEEELHGLRMQLQAEKDHHKEALVQLETQLDEQQSLVQSLETKQATLKEDIVDLKQEVEALQKSLEERDQAISTQQRTFESDLALQTSQWEQQTAQWERDKAEEIQTLQSAHVEEIRQLKKLLENEIAALKHGLEVASSEAARNIDEVERKYQAEVAKKTQEVEAKRQLLENMKEEHIRALDTLHADVAIQIQEARRMAVRGKDVELTDLRHRLEDVETALSQEKMAKESVQRQLKALEREHNQVRSEIELLEAGKSEEATLAVTELKAQHARAMELLRRTEESKWQQRQEDHAAEVLALQTRLETLEQRTKDYEKKHIEKVVSHDALESEMLFLKEEAAKWKEKVNRSETEAAQRVQQLRENQEAALNALHEQLAQLEKEKQEMMDELRQGEAQRARQESNFLRKLDEKEAKAADELQRALEEQKKELQEEYLNSIRQQIDLVVSMIQAQGGGRNAENYLQELQSRFMDLVQDLPDLWKQRHGIDLQEKLLANANSSKNAQSVPRTPLHILAQASAEDEPDHDSDRPYFEGVPRRRPSDKQQQVAPWNSPSLRASPTDQLIAAILDGDVQGIRAVVRSKGDDLRADFWHDLAKSVLPVHRAISGLHFHGSEKLLIATIEVLVQLGADITAIDHAGNSVLHKAIQVCTSKSAAAVVQCLLNRGADPRTMNKEGDTALHAECRRIRTASCEVIEALLAAGCDPNVKNPHNLQLTALTLVLLRGASTTPTGMSVLYQLGAAAGQLGSGLSSSIEQLVQPSTSAAGSPTTGINKHNMLSHPSNMNVSPMTMATAEGSKGGANNSSAPRSSSRKTWIKAAELLIKSGATWDPQWRSPHGCTQLHLLLSAFPPSREDSSTFRALLKSALDTGVNPASEDNKGRNALFVLCEQMAMTPSDQAPDAPRLIHMLIDASSVMTPQQQQYGIGGSDRTGRTIFDIHETVPHSCLHACKSLLVQATSKAAAASAASGYRAHNTATQPTHKRGQSLGSYDWDQQQVSRVSSAVVTQSQSMNDVKRTRSGVVSASVAAANAAAAQQQQRSRTNSHSSLPGDGQPSNIGGSRILPPPPVMSRVNSNSSAYSQQLQQQQQQRSAHRRGSSHSSANGYGYFDSDRDEDDEDDRQVPTSSAASTARLTAANLGMPRRAAGSGTGGIAASSRPNSASSSAATHSNQNSRYNNAHGDTADGYYR